MGPSRCFPSSFHGSEHRGGIRLGLDAALRALVPVPDLKGHGGELVGAWLGWFSYGFGVLDAFRCFFMLERRFRA